MTSATDHKAQEMAREAQVRLEEHEKLCTQRWTEAAGKWEAVFGRLRTLQNWIIVTQGAVILFLAGLIWGK